MEKYNRGSIKRGLIVVFLIAIIGIIGIFHYYHKPSPCGGGQFSLWTTIVIMLDVKHPGGCASVPNIHGQEIFITQVFKTKKDYSNSASVPLMEGQGSKFDIILPTSSPQTPPIPLHNGYYMPTTQSLPSAFLSMTREQYNKLPRPFTETQLIQIKNAVIDTNPFMEYYDCPYEKNQDKINAMDNLIDTNMLSVSCNSYSNIINNGADVKDLTIYRSSN